MGKHLLIRRLIQAVRPELVARIDASHSACFSGPEVLARTILGQDQP